MDEVIAAIQSLTNPTVIVLGGILLSLIQMLIVKLIRDTQTSMERTTKIAEETQMNVTTLTVQVSNIEAVVHQHTDDLKQLPHVYVNKTDEDKAHEMLFNRLDRLDDKMDRLLERLLK